MTDAGNDRHNYDASRKPPPVLPTIGKGIDYDHDARSCDANGDDRVVVADFNGISLLVRARIHLESTLTSLTITCAQGVVRLHQS